MLACTAQEVNRCFPFTCDAFEEIETFGPHDFYMLQRAVQVSVRRWRVARICVIGAGCVCLPVRGYARLCPNVRVSDVSTQDDGVTSLKTCVSVCKLSDWDPEVFLKYRQVILGQVRGVLSGYVLACRRRFCQPVL